MSRRLGSKAILSKSANWRAANIHKFAVPAPESPLMELLERPNTLQDKAALFAMTYINLAVEGEFFWVLTSRDGTPIKRGEMPGAIWPVECEKVDPDCANGHNGPIIGWKVMMPSYMPRFYDEERSLGLHQVVQFKMPNPFSPIRGMSPLTPLGGTIESDMLIQTHNRSVIENGGVPKAVLEFEGDLSPDDEKKYLDNWNAIFSGAEQAGKIGTVSGGFRVKPIAMSPEEMGFEVLGLRNREAQLAALNTPPSVLGLTDISNYASQLGQDRNFIDKHIIPMWRLVESAIEGSSLNNPKDNYFGAHDLSNVEALRAGLMEKIEMVKMMCGSEIHAPPKVAFSLVGLEVEEYEDDDTAYINMTMGTLEQAKEEKDDEDILQDSETDHSDDPSEAQPEGKPRDEEPEKPDTPEDTQRSGIGFISKSKKTEIWDNWIEIQVEEESKYKTNYRDWVSSLRDYSARKFSDATKHARLKADDEESAAILVMLDILPQEQVMRSTLEAAIISLVSRTIEKAFDFTGSELPFVDFEIDDAVIRDRVASQIGVVSSTTPVTLYGNLVKAWQDGVSSGDTIGQLRLRIMSQFDIASATAKAISVARTFSSGVMNAVRDAMFRLGPISDLEWLTARDEKVRDSHVLYGNAGPRKPGFNYMTLRPDGLPGILEFPDDHRAPAQERINCRCMQIIG